MFTLLKHLGLDSAGFDYTYYLYQTQYKTGPKHDDFTEFEGTWIDKNDSKKFARYIIVLTNRGIYGIPSLFVTSAKSMQTVKVMGDSTAGIAGLTTSKELANGWVLTYTSSKIRSSEGLEIIDGVAPDTLVSMKSSDESAGKDTMIEAALAELKIKP
jgi:C-terminal processing protease CtpA/Prc